MKNRIQLIVSFLAMLIFFCQSAFAQSTSLAPNLVPNSAFELAQTSKAPRGWRYSDNANSPKEGVDQFNSDIVGWRAFRTGSADWMDPTINPEDGGNYARLEHKGSAVPCNYDGRFVFMAFDESIGIKLDQKLISGKKYILKISALRHDVGPTSFAPDPDKYLVAHLSDKLAWYQVGAKVQNNIAVVYGSKYQGCMVNYEFTFIATQSNLEYLILEPIQANFNVDNVELYQEICHDELIITDKVFKNKHIENIQSKTITAKNKTQPQPSGDWTVRTEEGRKTVFKAEEKVVLKPGFLAKSGSEFNAFIAPCGEPCKPAKMPDGRITGSNHFVPFCYSATNGFCVTLNQNLRSEQGLIYEWTAQNPSLFIKTKNLVELNFCLTSTQLLKYKFAPRFGSITLYFKVTDKCNNSIVDTFTLLWRESDANATQKLMSVDWTTNEGTFAFSHSPNMYKAEIFAFLKNDLNETEVEKKEYVYGKDFQLEPYHLLTFSKSEWNNLQNGIDYCFRIRSYFYCDNNAILTSDKECITW